MNRFVFTGLVFHDRESSCVLTVNYRLLIITTPACLWLRANLSCSWWTALVIIEIRFVCVWRRMQSWNLTHINGHSHGCSFNYEQTAICPVKIILPDGEFWGQEIVKFTATAQSLRMLHVFVMLMNESAYCVCHFTLCGCERQRWIAMALHHPVFQISLRCFDRHHCGVGSSHQVKIKFSFFFFFAWTVFGLHNRVQSQSECLLLDVRHVTQSPGLQHEPTSLPSPLPSQPC